MTQFNDYFLLCFTTVTLSIVLVRFIVYAHGRGLCIVIGSDMEVQPLVTHNAA